MFSRINLHISRWRILADKVRTLVSLLIRFDNKYRKEFLPLSLSSWSKKENFYEIVKREKTARQIEQSKDDMNDILLTLKTDVITYLRCSTCRRLILTRYS